MSTTVLTKNIGFFSVGDTFCVEYTVTNSSPVSTGDIAQNVVITVTPDTPQLSFDGASTSVDKGIFNSGTGEWSVGSLLPCKSATASFCFTIDEGCPKPFEIEFDIDSDLCDCTVEGSVDVWQVDGMGCCDLGDCGYSGPGGLQYTTLTSGTFNVVVGRYGGGAPTLTVNSVGDYTIVSQLGSNLAFLEIDGDSSSLTGTGEFIIRVDNSANSSDKRYISQMYAQATGALVDVFATGNNHTRTFVSNVTSYTYAGMSIYGVDGFHIELR